MFQKNLASLPASCSVKRASVRPRIGSNSVDPQHIRVSLEMILLPLSKAIWHAHLVRISAGPGRDAKVQP